MKFILGMMFGTILKAVVFAFKLIVKMFAKILLSLNLGLPFVYCTIALILHLAFDILKAGSDLFYVFHFGLIVVGATSVLLTLKKFLGPFKLAPEKPNFVNEQAETHIVGYSQKPNVFRVRENPDYVVYEYYDKYNLFKENENGKLIFIRTDFKYQQPNNTNIAER